MTGIFLWRMGIMVGFASFSTREKLTYLGLAVFVVGTILYTIISMAIHKKKGIDSPAKHRIEEIINEVTEGDTSLTAAYALWRTVETHGNRSINRFWYYAIGFNRERIVIVYCPFLPRSSGRLHTRIS